MNNSEPFAALAQGSAEAPRRQSRTAPVQAVFLANSSTEETETKSAMPQHLKNYARGKNDDLRLKSIKSNNLCST